MICVDLFTLRLMNSFLQSRSQSGADISVARQAGSACRAKDSAAAARMLPVPRLFAATTSSNNQLLLHVPQAVRVCCATLPPDAHDALRCGAIDALPGKVTKAERERSGAGGLGTAWSEWRRQQRLVAGCARRA